MKTTITGVPPKAPRPFPKLMEHRENPGYIAVVNSDAEGTIISSLRGLYRPVGERFQVCYSVWVDFEGSITLSND